MDNASRATTSWQAGDRLTVRGISGTVVQHTVYPDCEALRVDAFPGRRSRTFLLPFDRPRRIEQDRLTVVSARAWRHAFGRLLLESFPHGGLRYCPATIDLIPYQLQPALAVLRYGYTRLLVADEVGMGKTIEAGLILHELAERQDGFRALILVPAGLRQQWADELASRFGIGVLAADAAWLRSIVRSLPADVNPWSPPGTYLASLDFVKRPECLRALEDVRWDMLVVDEAHAAAIATDRRAAVDAIAGRARTVILLTATPPVEPSQFEALCRVGHRPGSPRILMFQRRRASPERAARRSVLLAVRLTDDERGMHRMLARYTTLVWRQASALGNGHGRLAAIILRKRALSSTASLAASLARRQTLLEGSEVPGENQLVLPLDETDEDAREDIVPDAPLGSSVLSDYAVERRWLGALRRAVAAAATRESKARVLIRLLKRIRQPAIVFTEYRDTLEHLRKFLTAADLPACVLHGGLPMAERRRALAEFACGDQTLLATDAAAEGLNLQHTSRVIVHFELPWSPSRMLQRAGRVDRIGQQHRVHEIALVASDTAESVVLAPMARRTTGWFCAGRGGRMLELLTESRVAEAIFAGRRPEPATDPATDDVYASLDLSNDAQRESLRLEGQRAVTGRTRSRRGTRVRASIPVTVLRSSRTWGAVLIFELKTSIRHGDQDEIVERSHVALHAALGGPAWPRRPVQIRLRLSRLLPQLLAAAEGSLQNLCTRQQTALEPWLRDSRARARRREDSILASQTSAARELVQAGLFDRRALRASAARQRLAADLLELHDGATSGEKDALVSSTRLRAVLLVVRR